MDVLILVLLELTLLLFRHWYKCFRHVRVLILVLLELTLLHLKNANSIAMGLSFNPCFIGTYSITTDTNTMRIFPAMF